MSQARPPREQTAERFFEACAEKNLPLLTGAVQLFDIPPDGIK
jgi:hypothetical protein